MLVYAFFFLFLFMFFPEGRKNEPANEHLMIFIWEILLHHESFTEFEIYGCVHMFVGVLCHFSPLRAVMRSDQHCLEVSAVEGSTFRLDRCNDRASAGYFGGWCQSLAQPGSVMVPPCSIPSSPMWDSFYCLKRTGNHLGLLLLWGCGSEKIDTSYCVETVYLCPNTMSSDMWF